MGVWARSDELTEKAIQARLLDGMTRMETSLRQIGETMATLVQVANEVRDAVNARIDREIAKARVALDAKQAELDALIAVEDAEDVEQNAQIAALQAELGGQSEAIAVLESIKSGVNSDLAGDGGMVVPDPVVEPTGSEGVVTEPVDEVPADQ